MRRVSIVHTAIIVMVMLIIPSLSKAVGQTQSRSDRRLNFHEAIQAAIGPSFSVRLLGSGTLHLEQFERGERR